MKIHTKILAVLTAVTLLGGYGVALAATTDGQNGQRPVGQGMMGVRGPGARGPGAMGSTTWNGHGTSTEVRDGLKNGSSTGMMGEGFRGFPGVVTEVDADHFLMNTRGLGSAATTTFTVNVNSSTHYRNGSSTVASLSDITVGTKVVVLGKVATSTKTITADRVTLNALRAQGPRPQTASAGGFLDKLKSFFMGQKTSAGAGQPEGTSGGPAAAAAGGDFFGNFMNAVFGWMH